VQPPHSAQNADRLVAGNLRRNFTALSLDYGLFMLGMTFSSTATMLPALAERLGAPSLIIAAFPTLALLGRSLPALFSPHLIEPLPRKLPFVLTYTLWERLPWLGLAIAVFALGESRPGLVLALLVLTLAAVSMVGGYLGPAWMELVGKTIPAAYRGRFFAAGSTFSTGTGLLGAVLAAYLLQEYSFPLGYALCIGATFLALMASYGAMAMTREPAVRPARSALPLRSHLARLPAVLRVNRSFTWHLLGRGLAVLAMMVTGFYTVHALRSLGAAEWNVGSFTFAMLGAQSIGALGLGFLADRMGHRVSLMIGSISAAAAAALALAASDLLLYHGVFALAGVGLAAASVSAYNLVMELAGEEGRPTYIGVASAAQAPFALAAPLLGGTLAETAGLPAVFVAAILLNVASAGVYLLRVQDPRRVAPTV
jgi:MFS family permease